MSIASLNGLKPDLSTEISTASTAFSRAHPAFAPGAAMTTLYPPLAKALTNPERKFAIFQKLLADIRMTGRGALSSFARFVRCPMYLRNWRQAACCLRKSRDLHHILICIIESGIGKISLESKVFRETRQPIDQLDVSDW